MQSYIKDRLWHKSWWTVIYHYLTLHTLVFSDRWWASCVYYNIFNVGFFFFLWIFYSEIVIMTNPNPARVVLMLVGLFTFLAAIMLNLLSGFGEKSGEYCFRIGVVGGFWFPGGFQIKMLNSECRCLHPAHRGCHTQVHDTLNSSSVGVFGLGFHLFLDFCHVYILCGRALQKVSISYFFVTLHLQKIEMLHSFTQVQEGVFLFSPSCDVVREKKTHLF